MIWMTCIFFNSVVSPIKHLYTAGSPQVIGASWLPHNHFFLETVHLVSVFYCLKNNNIHNTVIPLKYYIYKGDRSTIVCIMCHCFFTMWNLCLVCQSGMYLILSMYYFYFYVSV